MVLVALIAFNCFILDLVLEISVSVSLDKADKLTLLIRVLHEDGAF